MQPVARFEPPTAEAVHAGQAICTRRMLRLYDGIVLRSFWLLMGYFNSKGVFSNRDDRLEKLQNALMQRFSHVTVRTVGSVALFSARYAA